VSDIVMYLRVLSASLRRYTPGADHLPGALDDADDEITRLRAEVERLRMTPEDHEALAWAIAVTWTIYDDPIGQIKRDTLRDLARRHGRDAAPIV